MPKNSYDFFGIKQLKNVKVLCCLALFVAISIVSGKFLALSIGEVLRISFENLTIILAGVVFGPFAGMITGICADIIGCILRGYNIIPILTIGAAFIGFISGVTYNLFNKTSLGLKLTVSCFVSHLIGSVVIKSIGLALYYNTPLMETVLLRLINYSIVFAAETFVLILLIKNKGFKMQIDRIKR